MQKVTIVLFLILSISACSWFSKEPTRAENPVIRGVDYVGMSVSDLVRSSDLYANAADLKPIMDKKFVRHPLLNLLTEREDTEVSTRLMQSVNAQIRLMQFQNMPASIQNITPVDVFGPGIAHVCYQVAKKTNTYEVFLQNGATHIGDADMVQLSSKNPVYYAYARDPDNILLEVEHVDVAALEVDTPPKNDYRIRHVSLATPDMDRLVAFYSILLETSNPRRAGRLIKLSGDKLDRISGLPESEIEMAWFQIRNLELEIVQYHSHPTNRSAQTRPFDALGYNSIVFDVTNIDAARDKLEEAGGEVVGEVQSLDGGQILFGRDPDGNLLGFQSLIMSAAASSQKFKDNGI